jgi:hypothetical protein
MTLVSVLLMAGASKLGVFDLSLSGVDATLKQPLMV